MKNEEKKLKREIRDPYLWEIVLMLGILIGILSFSLIVLGTEAHIPFLIFSLHFSFYVISFQSHLIQHGKFEGNTFPSMISGTFIIYDLPLERTD